MNPFLDRYSVFLLCSLFRRLRPDLVHLITVKPVLYGGVAARIARVPAVVSAMAGLGSLFTQQAGFKVTLLRRLLVVFFKCKHPAITVLQQYRYPIIAMLPLVG
jgi:hypothetical protein